MYTTIQLKQETKEGLERLRSNYKKRVSCRVTYDEMVSLLIESQEGSFNKKRLAADFLFGKLTRRQDNLLELRKEEEKRLEIISGSGRK